MKGQHAILSEIMLFAVGAVMTSFILLNYQNVHENMSALTVKDGMLYVNDLLSTGIIKSAESHAIVRIRIPDEISGHIYTISASGNNIVLSSFENPWINVTRQLFNISQSHNITIKGNILLSSSEYLQIRPFGSNISIEEW